MGSLPLVTLLCCILLPLPLVRTSSSPFWVQSLSSSPTFSTSSSSSSSSSSSTATSSTPAPSNEETEGIEPLPSPSPQVGAGGEWGSGNECKFYTGTGENRRFERVSENLPVGHELFRVEVHPRREFKLDAVENSLQDTTYFTYEEIDAKTIAVKLAQSLEDLVDRRDPQSVLKFKLTCRGAGGSEEVFLPVTVYVQDVNDHAPEFQNVPYNLEVDELTPVGVTVFRGIHAIDRDKPNTANSDITYSIVGGNENNSFILSDPIEGTLVVNKALDYDNGIREFKIQIQASDHGTSQSLSQVTTMSIRIKDADDQNPIFSQDSYSASLSESVTITGQRIREKVVTSPAIHAFDLDTGINARLRYSILLGNEGGYFEMQDQTGDLFLVREIDLETLPSATISLQIQATQVDNPLRTTTARVDISVIDLNDNRPEFEYDMYNITVMENLPPGFTVLQVYAFDADKGDNSEFKYVLDDPSKAFRIDEKTGWISVKDPTRLDREAQSKIMMKVTAVEKRPQVNASSVTSVEINLLDANDNNPQFFPSSLYTFNVLETAPSETIVGSVFAHDNDLAENGQVVYYKQNDTISQNAPFDVHLHNGSVFVLESFAHLHKKQQQYTFFVVASDMAKIMFERRTGVAVVRVNVTDINNSVPEFVGAPFESFVGESLPEGAFVTQIHARDADTVNDIMEYSIIAGNDDKLFSIDARSGKIYTASVLDYEKKQTYDLLVQVSDGINTAVAPLLVNVVDINDQVPIFAHNFYNFSVIEELNPNTTVGSVLALDRDSGKNSQLRYTIVGDSANEALYVDSATGIIRTRKRLDRETESVIDFVMMAFDSGIPQLSGSTSVRVKIEDVNDNPPRFSEDIYRIEVSEEIIPPLEVFQVVATDADFGDNAMIKYLILAGNEDNMFNINPDTGLLTTTNKLNFEVKSEYLLHVAARNLRPFQGPNSTIIVNPAVQVHIKVRDINDEQVIFDQGSYHIQVYENTPVDTVIGLFNVSNPNKGDQDITYWTEGIKGSDVKFFMNPLTGELSLRDTIDRDPPSSEHSFRFHVFARDKNSINTMNTSVPVVVEVIDVNDNPPQFDKESYVLDLAESVPLGTTLPSFYQVGDIDAGINGKITGFQLNGSSSSLTAFKINELTGAITLISPLDYETTRSYDFEIIASDGGTPQAMTRCNVTIRVMDENDWTPTFLNETFIMNVTEGPTSIGTRIRLPVVDYDDGPNRQMEVFIIDGNENGEFRLDVDEAGPLLTIVSELDREKYGVPDTAFHFVFVAAKDKGVPPRTGRTRVAVAINDINDTPPKFERDSYYEFVREDVAIGSTIVTLKATDMDSPSNTDLVYSFARGSNLRAPFMIDPRTGVVNVSRALDISESEHYDLTVQAFDGVWKSTTNLKIFLSEAEERDPRFDQLHYRFAVPENLVHVLVGRVELKTRKQRVNALMRYTIVNTEMRALFNITSEGEIYTRKGLDREKRAQYVFTVMLEEKRPSTKVTVSEVIVDVLDVNDEVPTFSSSFRGTIRENADPGTHVVIGPPTIQAVDNDAGNNSVIHYFLMGEGSDLFTILDSGSVLFTPTDSSQVLDRETKSKFILQVSAMDSGNLSSATSLTIDVTDENDNPPVFSHGPLFVLLPEIPKPGLRVVQVKATDADEPNSPNSKITYFITHGARGDLKMDKTTGEIFVVGVMKPGTFYFLNVSAVDKGGLATGTTINVTVVDVNEHRPRFDSHNYHFEVNEGNYTDSVTKLGKLTATDEDSGPNGQLHYSILSSVPADFPFFIDRESGQVFAKGFIDREARENYNFEVTATDTGEPAQNSSCEVHVRIKDVNDVRPRFYTDPYLAHVPENLDPGHKVTQIAAFDPDLGENGQVFYKLGEGHDNKFYIDGKDGTVWTLSKLDFEEKNFYNISIIAYDRGTPSLSATAKLWVTVADMNDAVPDFSKAVYTLEVAENAKPGDTVFTLNAGEGAFKYSLINAPQVDTFTVDQSNGRVKLAKPLDSVSRNHYKLMVKAEDHSDPPKFDTAEVNIIIGTGQGVRLFQKRFYEVTVQENQLSPLLMIDLNCTDEISHRTPHYTLVGTDFNGLFKIEPDTGRVTVMKSLDRETKDKYTLKIKAESYESRRGKRDTSSSSSSSPHSFPSSSTEDFDLLAFDETLVIVHVGDDNDNTPVFENKGKPLVAAVPLEASFGYQVTKVTAKDADTGINAGIRYEILSKGDDASSKFYVDPATGVIRSMVTFSLDGGKLFSFDVKATDQEGAEHGNSAVTTIFVYVLPETKMVLFVTNSEPIVVEKKSKDILDYLSSVTGFDVKMAKLEPHKEGDLQDAASTDLFLYAINPDTNDIIDTDVLLDVFRQNSQSIVENLDSFRIRRIQGVMVQEKISQMGATEVAIIALSSVIFLGTILAIALLCSTCKERKLRKAQTSWEQNRLYNIKNPLMSKALNTPYSNGRVLAPGHSNSTYSTGDGNGSEYGASIASFNKIARSVPPSNLGPAATVNPIAPGSRLGGSTAPNKTRQQIPADGSSSLHPPRSPRFSDRYRVVNGSTMGNSVINTPKNDLREGASDDHEDTWFESKVDTAVIRSESGSGSGYSRTSDVRSERSGYSGSSWTSTPKSRVDPATEL